MRTGEPEPIAAAFSTAFVPPARQLEDALGRKGHREPVQARVGSRKETVPQLLVPSCPADHNRERTMMTHLPNPSCQAAGQSFCFAFSGSEQSVLE